MRKGVDMGPLDIRHAGLITKLRDMGFEIKDAGDIQCSVAEDEGNPKIRYEKEINESNAKLYEKVLEAHKENRFPIILGGDHSIAAGSASATLTHFGKIGVIWVDAHADFNDDTTTPSGNIHAMGIREVMKRALAIASNGTEGIHLSFDMDALDPTQAPGVGTPVHNGLTQREAFIICEMMNDSGHLKSMDLVETNPLLDNRNATGILASELITACLGSTDYVLLGV